MVHDDIYELIASKINGEKLTAGEEEILSRWLEENPEHIRFVRQFTKYYRAYGLEKGMDAGNVYPVIVKGIENRKALQRKKWRRYISYAASVLLLAGSVAWWNSRTEESLPALSVNREIRGGEPKAILTLASGEQIRLHARKKLAIEEKNGQIYSRDSILTYFVKDSIAEEQLVYNTLKVPRGGEFRLMLADGTKVWLNAETELVYPVAFSRHKREVTLKGEAYFEVAKDSLCPFLVSSRGSVIRVLGTSFNVMGYADMPEVVTTLAEGQVSMESVSDPSVRCVLNPGEQALFNPDTKQLATRKAELDLYLSWKDGYYTFEKEKLENIMNTLSRWYDVEVFFENQGTREMRYSGKVRRYAKIKEFLSAIRMTDGVDFRMNGKTVIVYHK